MKLKKTESGRSMVEMLGVLAIIGVLSVGGIAGYSLSMRRHRANGVADIVSKYALVAYSHCQQQVLNGEASELAHCKKNETGVSLLPTFANAGVGTLPAGVTFIGGMTIGTNPTTGVDVITVSARFDDDKLCQAVGSIAGENCNEGSVEFSIKQN